MFRRVSDNVHYAVIFIKCSCAAQSNYPGISVAFHETRLCQNLPDMVIRKYNFEILFEPINQLKRRPFNSSFGTNKCPVSIMLNMKR